MNLERVQEFKKFDVADGFCKYNFILFSQAENWKLSLEQYISSLLILQTYPIIADTRQVTMGKLNME